MQGDAFFISLYNVFRYGMWVASVGVPDNVDIQEVSPEMDPMEKEHMTALMDTSEIAADSTFLKCKVLPQCTCS